MYSLTNVSAVMQLDMKNVLIRPDIMTGFWLLCIEALIIHIS